MKRFCKVFSILSALLLILTYFPLSTALAEESTAPPASYSGEGISREGGHADKNASSNELTGPVMGGEEMVDFSENNLLTATYNSTSPTTYVGDYNTGGTLAMAAAYFARWGGPVNESDDPYPYPPMADYVKYRTGISPATRVSDILMIPHTDLNNSDDIPQIKQAVSVYGAAYASIQYLPSSYFNPTTHAYYLPPSQALASNYGHAVTIVGWDDNYPTTNFKVGAQPVNKGAFLVKNSYGMGGSQGDGFFYISYEDKCLGKQIVINDTRYANTTGVFITGDPTTESYDHIYQYDPYGHTSNYSFNTPPSYYYIANKFSASGNETIKAVSFYTQTNNVPYQVYIVKGNASSVTLPAISSLPAAIASGTQAYPGYHTVTLSNGVPLTTGQKFAVIVRFPGKDGNGNPARVSYEDFTGSEMSISTVSGQSFIYKYGDAKWYDFFDYYDCGNLCIKAFTVDTTTGGLEESSDIGETGPAIDNSFGQESDKPTASESAEPKQSDGLIPGVSEAMAPGESEIISSGENATTYSNNNTESETDTDTPDMGISYPTLDLLTPADDAPPTGGNDEEDTPFGLKLERYNLYSDEGSEPVTGAVLPAQFDLRTIGIVSPVKNQGAIGSCWTFAAMASAESTYLKNKSLFVGNVTLSKDSTFLWNDSSASVAVTADCVFPNEVDTYYWDTPEGENLVDIYPSDGTCIVKPKVSGSEGIVKLRCIVLYKNGLVREATDDISIVVADYTGDGSLSNPYKVSTAKQLELLGGFIGSEYNGKYFMQTKDINLSGIPNWKPIGTYYYGYAFEGNYDGNGYVITGLTINTTQPASENTGLGLFNCIENGTIKDVIIADYSINVSAPQDDGNYIIGGLAGRADNAIVQDCQANGTISVTLTGAMKTYTYSGGLIGYAFVTSISHCGFMGEIKQNGGVWSNLGGLLAYAETGTIDESFAISKLSSKGQTDGQLSSISGLVDEMYGTTIENSYAVSNITASGLPETSDGVGMTAVTAQNSFTNCYASTQITGPEKKGAFLGSYDDTTMLKNCFYNQSSPDNMGPPPLGTASGGLKGLTPQQLQTPDSFIGWDFPGTWAISPVQNGGFPILKNPIVYPDYYSLSENSQDIYHGSKPELKIHLEPTYSSPMPLTVAFEPQDILSIDTSGKLVPLKRGEVEIKIHLNDSDCTSGDFSVDSLKGDTNLDGVVDDDDSALTDITDLLTGKKTPAPGYDYYPLDIDGSSATPFEADANDITLADLLTFKQYQAGVRTLN